MTPRQLSSVLRHIAAKIDNSKNPSRAAVSSELLKVLHRIASRTDVTNAVDHAFNAKGVYPPVMKQTDPNTYEGEIDTGWNLKVVENSPGVMDVYLNNKSISGLEEAVKAYTGKNARYLPPRVMNSWFGDLSNWPSAQHEGVHVPEMHLGDPIVVEITHLSVNKNGEWDITCNYVWSAVDKHGNEYINDVTSKHHLVLKDEYEGSYDVSLIVNGQSAKHETDAEQRGLFNYGYTEGKVTHFMSSDWAFGSLVAFFEDEYPHLVDSILNSQHVDFAKESPNGDGIFIQ